MDFAGSDHHATKLTRPPHRRTTTGRRRERVTTIISDIDDVLLTFDPQVFAGIEERHGLPVGRLRLVLHERPTAKAATIGMLDQQAFLSHARAQLPAEAIQEWLDYHGTPNQPVIDLLWRARHSGRRILLLANATSRRHDDLAHHGLTELVERVYLSAETRHAKPDPAAWLHALRHSRTEAARALTIDSHPAWAQAGRQLGMRGHHYVDAERLRRALSRASLGL